MAQDWDFESYNYWHPTDEVYAKYKEREVSMAIQAIKTSRVTRENHLYSTDTITKALKAV